MPNSRFLCDNLQHCDPDGSATACAQLGSDYRCNADTSSCLHFGCSDGIISSIDCKGSCRPSQYEMTKAQFTNSKTAIVVDLNAPAAPGVFFCSAVFDENTTISLGASAMCTVSNAMDKGTLQITLGVQPTVTVGDELKLALKSALVSKSHPLSTFKGTITVVMCSQCELPIPSILGPKTAAAPCNSGATGSSAFELRFDGRSSRDPSNRQLLNAVWTATDFLDLPSDAIQVIDNAIRATNSKLSIRYEIVPRSILASCQLLT